MMGAMLPFFFFAMYEKNGFPAEKNGSIAPIIRSDAADVPISPLVKKYKGIPATAAPLKQMICLFVKFSATFVLIPDKSFGTCTDIAISFLP